MVKPLSEAKGSSAIPMVPFDDLGRIDHGALERELEFILSSGCTSIATPMIVSEFLSLSEEERRLMISLPVQASGGRIPVIANVAACDPRMAAEYARYAQNAGADALIAMSPWAGNLDADGQRAYFKTLSEATTLPIMIQNVSMPGVQLSPERLMMLCEEFDNILWVKQEVAPAPLTIQRLLDIRTPALEGVMSGMAGIYSPLDFRLGATATIHACEFCDLMQRIWNLLAEGRDDEARSLHEALMPSLQLEILYGIPFCKEIMIRRGIFKNRAVRNCGREMTAVDMAEIDCAWRRVAPLLG